MPDHLDIEEERLRVQRLIEKFMKTMDRPAFVIFGYKVDEQNYSYVTSFQDIPPAVAMKVLIQGLHELAQQTL